jgi:hypothetical protein
LRGISLTLFGGTMKVSSLFIVSNIMNWPRSAALRAWLAMPTI